MNAVGSAPWPSDVGRALNFLPSVVWNHTRRERHVRPKCLEMRLIVCGGVVAMAARTRMKMIGDTDRLEDRRRAGRPQNGDTKPCPKCASSCDFNARYRLPDAGVVPAWICDSPACRYRELVRGADRTQGLQELIRGSRYVKAFGKRLILRARFLVQRSRARLT